MIWGRRDNGREEERKGGGGERERDGVRQRETIGAPATTDTDCVKFIEKQNTRG